jgi:hypothetical protein
VKSSTAIFYKALSILPAALLVLPFVFPSGAFAQAAKPLDPVVGIIDAFKTHDVVALGEAIMAMNRARSSARNSIATLAFRLSSTTLLSRAAMGAIKR